jgi:regulator of protease activity HflC (stomatin/prohibitin superfamily)
MNKLKTILVVCSATFLSLAGCATVTPGQVGVLWTIGSGTHNETYSEGVTAVAPWNQMALYDLRSTTNNEKLNVIANNGLAITLDASIRYHLIPKEVVAMQEEIGPNYYRTILEPVLRSEARRVIGQFTPEEIYSTKRDVIERDTREGVQAKIAGKHIALEAILIRNVELPMPIRAAIDKKLEEEQEVLRMKFVLEQARLVAEQRTIEAKGIADYNQIVSSSITPAILNFEKVQALEKLAASGNAKTVVLGQGSSKDELLLQTK